MSKEFIAKSVVMTVVLVLGIIALCNIDNGKEL